MCRAQVPWKLGRTAAIWEFRGILKRLVKLLAIPQKKTYIFIHISIYSRQRYSSVFCTDRLEPVLRQHFV